MTGGSTVRMAIAALRAGRPATITGAPILTVLPVETATSKLLALLDPQRKAPLLISGARAAALSLANLIDAADPERPVLIERSEWLDADVAAALVDPGQDFERAPIGPLHESTPASSVISRSPASSAGHP